MHEQLIPQSRAERLIATGRAVLALASFGAVYLDPLEPERWAKLTYSLLGVYSFYAIAYVVWTIVTSAGHSRRGRLISHVLDLTFFGAINYLTGSSSPFFVYFVFSIVCAMLRFGRRGTMITAVAALLVFIATVRIDNTAIEVNRVVIRSAYLLVVASLLVYLADYQQRIQADLSRIARWRSFPSTDYDRLINELMREPASIFGARRVLLAYEYLANRYGFLGTVQGERILCEPMPREHVDALVESQSSTFVRSGSFAAFAPGDRGPAVPLSRKVSSMPTELMRSYQINDVVATSFNGDFVHGRLLLLDGRSPLLEEVNLARITGLVIASRLDHYHAGEQLRRGAVAEERVRVARDLHDSVLQSLTGVALQIRTLPRLVLRDPQKAEERIDEIEQTIVTAQKDLRWFIEQLHPERKREAAEVAAMADRLQSLSQRFEKQWGLQVQSDVAPIIHLLPVPMRQEVYTIVSEAVANAAKHASAKCVRVSASVNNGGVRIDVADDGKGFPFRGRYSLHELMRMNRGPVTLKERVASLAGEMTIDSTDTGSRIEIRLPLRAVTA